MARRSLQIARRCSCVFCNCASLQLGLRGSSHDKPTKLTCNNVTAIARRCNNASLQLRTDAIRTSLHPCDTALLWLTCTSALLQLTCSDVRVAAFDLHQLVIAVDLQ